ncbi:MAG: hypothetical protein Q4G27_10320 [Flavobacteriaceae bacterium]|nr:hypothetical protein [Flavobacteriaceae bacterium]
MKKNVQLLRARNYLSQTQYFYAVLAVLGILSFSMLQAQTCVTNDGKIWNSNGYWLFTTTADTVSNTFQNNPRFRSLTNNNYSLGDINFGPDGKLYGSAWYGTNFVSGIRELHANTLNERDSPTDGTLRKSVPTNTDYGNNSLYIDAMYNFYYAYYTNSSTTQPGVARKVYINGPKTNNQNLVWVDVQTTIASELNTGTSTGDITIFNGKLYMLWADKTFNNQCDTSVNYFLLEFDINENGDYGGSYNYYSLGKGTNPQALTHLNGQLYVGFYCTIFTSVHTSSLAKINLPSGNTPFSYTYLSQTGDKNNNMGRTGQTTKTDAFSGMSNPPKPIANSGVAPCPARTFNLTSLQPSTELLHGTNSKTYEWHTVADNPSAATKVANPAAATAGTYYLYVKGNYNSVTWSETTPTYTLNSCYSPASAAVVITAENCITCTAPPYTGGPTNPTHVGISTLDRNVEQGWVGAANNGFILLESPTKGFVQTRMTTAQRNSLTPVEGMVIWNTTTQCLEFYNGTGWKCASNVRCQ